MRAATSYSYATKKHVGLTKKLGSSCRGSTAALLRNKPLCSITSSSAKGICHDTALELAELGMKLKTTCSTMQPCMPNPVEWECRAACGHDAHTTTKHAKRLQ